MRKLFFELPNPSVAVSLTAVASAYASSGIGDKAMDHSLQALAMCRTLYKDKHPDLASALHVMGRAY